MVDEAGLSEEFDIESAGTIGFHSGNPPDRRMQQVMRARGIPMIGRSKQLDSFDLEHYDLILAMDKDNLARCARSPEAMLSARRLNSSANTAPSTADRSARPLLRRRSRV